jgi:hypothetical protein
MATKAQLKKLEEALKREQANLAKAATAAAKQPAQASNTVSRLAAAEGGAIGAASIEAQIKRDAAALNPGSVVNPVSLAPTSGPVVGFTPQVVMPTPSATPRQSGFVGPVAPAAPVPPAPPVTSQKDIDAFALLKETFRLYDLEDLFPAIEKLMMDDVGPEQASLLLKTDPRYNAKYIERFSGNEARRKAGLNVLSEAEYLTLEDSYSQTLQSYGVQSQLGLDRKARQSQMANLIGSDVSATEFKGRIQTVVDRVKNADPSIKSTMTSFYGIKDEDLIGYFLNPKEGLPKLQEKVTAAEIGAAASMQSLATSRDAAEALARFGITKEEARTGYATIGEVLPTGRKLGEIYGDQYTQQTAEQEVFEGLASAKRKRQQLAEREVASFSGSSGRLRTGRAQGNTGQF